MKNSGIKTAIIGAGSWGTALALLLASKNCPVTLWGHRKEFAEILSLERENKKYLPGHIFPACIDPTSDMREAVEEADIVCMVVPSHGFRSVYRQVVPFLREDVPVVSAVKGIENSTLMTMSQVMIDVHLELEHTLSNPIGVLSGPSFAKEVADRMPTAITIGCSDIEVAKHLQHHFVTDYFRVYASTDIAGLEISGALKNIIAIATGICDGLGYGLNTRAALITRGLAEITRFGIEHNAQVSTFYGLSGIGDLMLTCTGDLSRNRTVGLKLGRGQKLASIQAEMNMVAEGVRTTKSVFEIARNLNIDMPILEQVHAILYQDKDCSEAVKDLLARELKIEE